MTSVITNRPQPSTAPSKTRSPRQTEPTWRCVGVGVGPSNLSLASLMFAHRDLPNVFLERRDAFGWHDGQQIPGAQLQVSMLKDLVSLSDPTNPFSFLAYLHQQGRMYHYLNAQFEAVPRYEFRNYLEWATRRNPNIVFGHEVREVDFDDLKKVFRVRTNKATFYAENIAVGAGSAPWVPASASPYLGDRQFHVSQFIDKAQHLGGLRVAVIGGGQSGAEAYLDLISRTDAERPRRVAWISRRPNFLPLDDSPFTNDYYMPCHSDYFAKLPLAERRTFNDRHILTSDGVTESTLRAIYQQIYLHRFVNGNPDLVVLAPNRAVREVGALTEGSGAGFQLSIAHNDAPTLIEKMEFDVIVWATGFRPAQLSFLAPLQPRLQREGEEYKIDENFAAVWDGPADRSIFLQNAARQQRGLADPNLSLLAWRSQRILDRLRGVRSEQPLASFIDWTAKPPSTQLG